MLFATFATSQTEPSKELDVWCFNCGSGVTRMDAGVAAQAACDYWWDTTMYPNSPNGGGLAFNYAWSGGNIALSVVPFWDSNGCTNVPYNDYFTNYDRCYYGFMTIIDGCNTGGVNGKQGGYYWDYCATVTINPNPDSCGNDEAKFAMPDTTDDQANTFTYFATDDEHDTAASWMRNSSYYAKIAAQGSQASPV